MKKQIKNEIKDWLQILGMSAVGGIAVLHVNSFFKPTDESIGAAPDKIEKVDSIAPTDSAIVMNKVAAARELFFNGVRRGLPAR